MTDYATLSDVYPLISKLGTLSTTTQPSAAQAGAICAQVAAEIDMHLRAKGYATPVTDSEAMAALTAVAMNGAAYRILKSAFPAASGVSGDGGAYTSLRDDYMAGLALIDAGGLSVDMATDESSETVSYNFTRPYDVLGSASNGETDSPF